MLTPTFFALEMFLRQTLALLDAHQMSDSGIKVVSFIDEYDVLTSLVEVVASQFRTPLVPPALPTAERTN